MTFRVVSSDGASSAITMAGQSPKNRAIVNSRAIVFFISFILSI